MMILDALRAKLVVILVTLIVVLLTSNAYYVLRLHFAKGEIEEYRLRMSIIDEQSKAAEQRYAERKESYEYAIDEIAKYYNETAEQIEDFKKDEHETECDAANRLLNSFKY